jgi:hypothetical protein
MAKLTVLHYYLLVIFNTTCSSVFPDFDAIIPLDFAVNSINISTVHISNILVTLLFSGHKDVHQ